MSFEEAWQSFKQIRYLNLGAASRADWIANIILYIPLTFSLAASFLDKSKSTVHNFFNSAFILIFSIALAITIEFCQQFFPPRTVSQNDLMAETIGSMIGLSLWIGYGTRLFELQNHILLGGRNAFLASATLYTLGYFAISFFPYDFVTSFQEIQNKLLVGNDGILIASNCGGFLRCTMKLTSEILLAIPLGIFFSVLLKWHPQRLTAVMLVGFIFGVIIETVQFFLVSGVAQGISVFTRIIGMGLGEKLYSKINLQQTLILTSSLRKYIRYLTLPYLLVLASLNGWSPDVTVFTAEITEKLSQIRWLPFYYHYYTTESAALNSLLSIALMYLPVGLGIWVWNHSGTRVIYSLAEYKAGFFAAGLALLMETSKLFLISKRPDPTNILIGFVSSYLAYAIADVMHRWLNQPTTVTTNSRLRDVSHNIGSLDDERNAHRVSEASDKQTGNPSAKIIACLIFAVLTWKLITYPASSVLLGMGLLLYALALHKYPQAWLICIPALLPILDFAPWTGRIFFSEFDYFILTTLSVSCWHRRLYSPFHPFKSAALMLLSVYTFFYMVSLVKGLFPLQPIDANAFTHYYSHYNSFRIGKGLLWALCLMPVLAYNLSHHANSNHHLSYGILTGLSLTTLFAIRERALFTGLFDFNSDMRITSTFYSMHTGGAHLDALLLMSMPFITVLLAGAKNKLLNSVVAFVVFSAGLYTLLVTFSRGTYIAFVIAAIVLCSGLLYYYKQRFRNNWHKMLWAPVFIILTIAIATPVLKGSFIQNRFKQSGLEANIRSSHWLNSIKMMDPDFFTYLFGMGLGSFPRNYFWKSYDENTPATFMIQQNQEESYLQIRSGAPLYIEQTIPVKPHTNYLLQFDYRTYADDSGLSIQICEKAVQHSFTCRGTQMHEKNSHQEWRHFSQTLNTATIGDNKNSLLAGFLSKPVKLILYNGYKNTTIDLKNIGLGATQENNLIRNGDFSQGMDYWFFSADDHIPWRTENQWVQILFELGWLGLFSFTLLFLYTMITLFQRISRQQFFSTVILSSLIGFTIIAIVDSPFDNPNIALLFFLLLFISFSNNKPKAFKSHS